MIIERQVKPSLTPVELDAGDTVRFVSRTGAVWEMTLRDTRAEVTARGTLPYTCAQHPRGDIRAYAFSCVVCVNGREHHLRREVGTQASFYEPPVLDGVRVWFDAAACAFAARGGFMVEKDWGAGLICSPARAARFALQEAARPICPEPIGPWFANQPRQLDIANCYCGEDCWMGPYNGASAHCGLDINMPAGTVLTSPIAFDDHYLYHSTAAGFSNNCWRGVRRWPDGSEWWLQALHLITMLVPERTPLARGTAYATTAGTHIGLREHTHFLFRVLEQGGDYLLDPWIVFAAASVGKDSTASP